MSARRTWFVAARVALQVRHDRRTLAYAFLIPVAVTLLLGYVLRNSRVETTIAVTGLPAAQLEAAPQPPGIRLLILDPASAGRRFADGEFDGLISVEGMDPPRVVARLRADALPAASSGRTVATRVAALVAAGGPSPAGLRPVRVEVGYLAGGPEFDALDYNAPGIVGFFPFLFVFILTTVSFLRERTQGTLERLLAAPLRRIEISGGYMLGFAGYALLQSGLVVVVALFGLGLHYHGAIWPLFLVVIIGAVGAVNLGILLSTYAATELQAVQFTPVVAVPQGLLSGLVFPLTSLPGWLQVIAHALPLTYVTDALHRLMIQDSGILDGRVLLDLGVLLLFAAVFLVLAALTIRRETA